QINNQDEYGYSTFDADTIWNRLNEIKTSWTIFWQEKYLPIVSPHNTPWTYKAFPRLKDYWSNFATISEFHRRARLGTLPAFSFIEPSWTIEAKPLKAEHGIQGDDMHPPGDVRPAEDLVAQVYTSLIANTNTWHAALLVITFDEHGGLFDHVSPP